MEFISPDYLKGRVRSYEAPSDDISMWTPVTNWSSNLVVYEWGSIVGRLLNGSGVNYSIGGMYLEFENVANASTVVTAPTQDRTRSISYYNDLSSSQVRDYLRVPLTATQLLSSNTTLYPHNNQCLFFARSAGTSGVHGKEFSDDTSTGKVSKLFGASLVAFVDDTDATQDLILSSFYFADASQQDKLSTSQIGVEWELTLQ